MHHKSPSFLPLRRRKILLQGSHLEKYRRRGRVALFLQYFIMFVSARAIQCRAQLVPIPLYLCTMPFMASYDSGQQINAEAMVPVRCHASCCPAPCAVMFDSRVYIQGACPEIDTCLPIVAPSRTTRIFRRLPSILSAIHCPFQGVSFCGLTIVLDDSVSLALVRFV